MVEGSVSRDEMDELDSEVVLSGIEGAAGSASIVSAMDMVDFRLNGKPILKLLRPCFSPTSTGAGSFVLTVADVSESTLLLRFRTRVSDSSSSAETGGCERGEGRCNMLKERTFFSDFRGTTFFSDTGSNVLAPGERVYNHDGSSGDRRNLSNPCGSWVAPGNAGNGEYDDRIKAGVEENTSGK